MSDLIRTIIKYSLETGYEDLSPEAIAYAKKSILDTIGCAIVGSSTDTAGKLIPLIRNWGGKEESTIPVFGEKVPAINAALVIGPMIRCSELDDVLESPHGAHTSGYIFPAVVPAADLKGNINGKEFITAFAVSQDLVYRFVAARRGMQGKPFKPIASLYFAVTAGVSRILGLDEETTWNAMGISYGDAASEGQSIKEGKDMIPVSHGIIASECVRAALLAQQGITGAREVLQGESGYYNIDEPDHDLSILTSQLGKVFYGPQTSQKRWPCCRIGHSAVDAALQIIKDNKVKSDDIKEITIFVTPYSYEFICMPEEEKNFPTTPLNAMFSAAYMIAVAVLKGTIAMEDFSEESIKSQEINNMLKRIRIVKDPSLTRPDMPFGSRITIETKTEDKYTQELIYPLGHPGNPLSMDMIIEKFRKCVPYSVKPFKKEKVDRIIDMVCNLEKFDSIDSLFGLLVP